jgi:Restriction endonuclease
VLDFKELGGSGRRLEQLVRELLLVLDLRPQWSGVGPDADKDLLFDEPGMSLLGSKPRTWLVSCKDYATSGRAVGQDDLDGLVEALEHHGAQGFLLVCTTHPSAGAVERLRQIETRRGGRLATHVWDGASLERLISQPDTWAVAQRFMPLSTDAAGWKVFGTVYPNQWVAVHRGQYFHLSSRVGGNARYDFESLDRRLDELARLEFDGVRMRVRGVWLDDAKGGGYVWYVDCMVPPPTELPQPSQLEDTLRSGVSREDGQFHSFEIEVHRIDWQRDHFDMDHYQYYKRLPSYV